MMLSCAFGPFEIALTAESMLKIASKKTDDLFATTFESCSNCLPA